MVSGLWTGGFQDRGQNIWASVPLMLDPGLGLSAGQPMMVPRCETAFAVRAGNLLGSFNCFWSHSMWDLSSLTRDQTPTSCIESIVLTTGPPGPWAPFKEVGFLRSKLQSYSHNPGTPSQTPHPCAQPSRTMIPEAWSPLTSSFSATWDLIRNADSQVP